MDQIEGKVTQTAPRLPTRPNGIFYSPALQRHKFSPAPVLQHVTSAFVSFGASAAVLSWMVRKNNGFFKGFKYLPYRIMTDKRIVYRFPILISTYIFVSESLYNLREGPYATNQLFGGIAAGLVRGIFFKGTGPLLYSIPGGVFRGALLGGIFALASHHKGFSSAKIANWDEDRAKYAPSGFDFDFEKQGYNTAVYRRPLSQTVDELGEGRGIHSLPLKAE